MPKTKYVPGGVIILLFASTAVAQQRPDFSKIIEAMDRDGCVVHEATGVRVCTRYS
jgi:hypothetical protein